MFLHNCILEVFQETLNQQNFSPEEFQTENGFEFIPSVEIQQSR